MATVNRYEEEYLKGHVAVSVSEVLSVSKCFSVHGMLRPEL